MSEPVLVEIDAGGEAITVVTATPLDGLQVIRFSEPAPAIGAPPGPSGPVADIRAGTATPLSSGATPTVTIREVSGVYYVDFGVPAGPVAKTVALRSGPTGIEWQYVGDTGWQTLITTAALNASVIDGAPLALNTLHKLADAINDSPTFGADTNTALAGKAALVHTHVSTDITDSGAAGRSILTAATVAAIQTILGLASAAFLTAGAANGVATLDSGGKVPSAQLPAAIVGALQYQGTWNASTNSPTLVSGTGTKGFFYKVSVAGTTALDGVSEWFVGDMIVFDGTTWDRIHGDATEVLSVAGKHGAVTLASSDLTDVGAFGGSMFAAATAAAARTLLGLGTAALRDAGVASGVATLGVDGIVPASQLPASTGGFTGIQIAQTMFNSMIF